MRHSFRRGMGPFIPRPGIGQDLPTAPDCARTTPWDGLRLRVRGNPLRTGMVHAPSWEFTEGYLEARARFPAPPGAHSGVWLQSPTPYATAEDHEVDVAEHFGHPNVQHSLWVGPWDAPARLLLAGTQLPAPASWRVYGIDVRASSYTWTIDGVEVARWAGPATARPHIPVLSVLSDDWERRATGGLLPRPVGEYGAYVDWVRLEP